MEKQKNDLMMQQAMMQQQGEPSHHMQGNMMGSPYGPGIAGKCLVLGPLLTDKCFVSCTAGLQRAARLGLSPQQIDPEAGVCQCRWCGDGSASAGHTSARSACATDGWPKRHGLHADRCQWSLQLWRRHGLAGEQRYRTACCQTDIWEWNTDCALIAGVALSMRCLCHCEAGCLYSCAHAGC